MKKRPILESHTKKGNTFYPPFLVEGSGFNFVEIEWRRDVLPELIWIAPLVHEFGMEGARRLACELVCAAGEESDWTCFPNIGATSSFAKLTPQQKSRVRYRMASRGILEDICRSVGPLVRLYPRCPLKFLLGGKVPQVKKRAAMEYMAPLLWDCLFRDKKLPTLVQGVNFDISVASGRTHFAEGLKMHDTRTLEDYPDSDDSQHTAAFMRIHANVIGQVGEPSFWPEYFWQRGNELGTCDVPNDGSVPLWAHSQAYILYQIECFRLYNEEMTEIWNAFESKHVFNLYAPLREEVLLGLTTRVYRLTVQLVSFMPNWTEDIGQVFVRMAVESYIYWKWLKEKGTDDDYHRFYEHGLGQQKLYMEHIASYLSEQGLSQEEIDEANPGLSFLKSHKMAEFVPVNVGNPLSKNLRQLSEEADLKEIYALVFGPTSSMVHGMYDSLDRYYLRRCVNPFHCLHRVPFYWAKSPVSGYGAANLLQITDWMLAEMLADVGALVPDEKPGEKYLERFYDEEAFTDFCERPEIVEAGRKNTRFVTGLKNEMTGNSQ